MRRMNTAPATRYHSLDALRAAMMLLGLVLHSGASYTYAPLRDAWPFHDPPGHAGFDILLVVIHLFRMPTFFVMAGFFGALLYYREGTVGFLRNRARRVALPLVIFAATALPLAGLGFLFAARQEGNAPPGELIGAGPLLRQPILGHLWFLYDLLIFYGVAALVVPLGARFPENLRDRATRVIRSVVTRWWGAVALGLVTTLTLLPMAGPGLETSAALLPPPRVLVAYGVFFAFGWCLYRQRDELVPAFERRWVRVLTLGIVVSIAYLVVLLAQQRLSLRTWHLAGVTLAGPAVWLWIYGIVGLFVRHLPRPRPRVRYLSDASYWMYLTHLTVITWTAGLLAPSPAHVVIKFAVVLMVTTLVTLVTYHVWVRPTRLGALLNGRRYSRSPDLHART